MFTKTAAWYDAVYAEKGYAGEAHRVAEIIGPAAPRKTLIKCPRRLSFLCWPRAAFNCPRLL